MRTTMPVGEPAPAASKPVYQSLADAPDTLRTKESWKREGRRLRKVVEHRAAVKWPDSEFSYDKLYAVEDTEPVKVSEAERWRQAYWRLFVQDHNHIDPPKYIWWSDTRNEWVTVTSRASPEVTGGKYKPAYLRRGDLRNHFSGRDIYGVFGGTSTHWLAVDLDRHDKEKTPATPAHTAVFLEQFRVLQADLFGRDNWHFQVKDNEAEGIHCIQVFSQRRDRAVAVRDLRERLVALDARHPELAARAGALGMKTFGSLEIYPDPKNGFRLPLARGRTMLLDRPLPLVANCRGRMVQDVAVYLSWLVAPQKMYMPASDVYQYLEVRLKPTCTSSTSRSAPAHAETGAGIPASARSTPPARRALVTSNLPHRLRGCYRQTLTDYWSSRLVVPNSLDAMILVTARILPFQNEDEEEGVQVLDGLVDGLTDLSVSSRLGTARGRRLIDKAIAQAARLVYRIEPSTESEKLCEVAAAFARRGFRLDDRRTWHQGVDFSWDAREMKVIEQVFLPLFPAASLEEVAAALRHFLRYMHGKASGEVAMKMWHLPFSRFPTITLGNRAKRTAFKKKLLEVGWLYERAAYRPPTAKGVKGRATAYAVAGSVRRKLLAVDAAVERSDDARVEDVWPQSLVGKVDGEDVCLLLH